MGLSAGTKLGPYEIVACLGVGGMGEVWKARDTRLDREVAIKVLPEEFFEDRERRERFEREAKLLAAVNHPNIAVIHSFEEISGRYLLVQELVEGETLSARLLEGALPSDDVLRLGHQLADALAHAHEHGVVHRDFKSANVIITPEGRAKVLDFGLAKKLSEKELDQATTLSRAPLTEVGTVAGTPAYMAPEQLRGLPADARSDVWALGVVLYEMAAGKRPFQGNTGFELSSAIFSQKPPPLPPAVPAALQGVIERCLAKEPAQRYQRGSEVRAALETVQSGRTLTPWPAVRYSLGRRPWLVFAAALVVTVAILVGLDAFGLRSRLFGGTGGGQAIRMAVLPFANLSGDPQQEYLSDGLTQEMIAQLGRLHPGSLSVIARTSVMRYKKTETPIDQIGKELGVEYVLEGSAQREGSRVRVSAELIRVKGQMQLWADSFEREMSGILALQSDVARKVAGALALKLLPAEQARLAGARQVNPEAYEAYLKGYQHVTRGTRSDLDTAEKYFELALRKEPDFAKAYVGLVWVWSNRAASGYAPTSIAIPKEREAALKAVALDDNLAASHEALAVVKTWCELDPPAADPEWRRAMELDPNDPQLVSDYCHYLTIMGRVDEARTLIDRAVSLDPFNVGIHALRAVDLLCARRYDEAIAEANKTLAMEPRQLMALCMLANALHMSGRHDEAIKAQSVYFANWLPDKPDIKEALERGYAEEGYAGAWRRAADVEASRYAEEPGMAIDAAWNYMIAGDKSHALDWLEKAYEVRDPVVPGAMCLPIFDAVRSDPRFKALMRRMNLPVAAPGAQPRPSGASP